MSTKRSVSGLRATNREGINRCAWRLWKTYRNIQKVLRAAGSDLDQILQMTSFIVDLPTNGPGYVTVRKKILTRSSYTSATIGVAALMIPGLLLEVQCIAATP